MSIYVLVPLFYSHPIYSKVKLAENCPFFYFFHLFHYKLSVKKLAVCYSLILPDFH